MSATAPFDGPPTRTDALCAALLAWLQVRGELTQAGELGAAFAAQEYRTFGPTFALPSFVAFRAPGLQLVSITGTQLWTHWIGNLLGSLQSSVPPAPGLVATFFGQAAVALRFQLWPILNSWPQSARLAFVGHSLGGALAQVLGAMAQEDGLTPTGIYVGGSPRVGDDAFASAIDAITWRLEATDDGITATPPEIWGGFPSPFPWPGPVFPYTYRHAGYPYQIDQYGRISANTTNPPGLLELIAQFAALAIPDHETGEYVRRLRQQFQLADALPGAQGFAKPALLLEADSEIRAALACDLPC